MKKSGMILVVLLVVALAATVYGQQRGGYGMGPGMMGGYGMGPGMMGGYYGQSPECQKFYDETSQLRKQLQDKRFEYYEAARNPETKNKDLVKLGNEIQDLQNEIFKKASDDCPVMGGYGMWPGMMGGYGMGPGMMGGYGMWPGMMGHGFQWQSEECNKYYDDTLKLRKQLQDKKFEYFEAARNPQTKAGQLIQLENEVRELQNQIYLKAPLGCRW